MGWGAKLGGWRSMSWRSESGSGRWPASLTSAGGGCGRLRRRVRRGVGGLRRRRARPACQKRRSVVGCASLSPVSAWIVAGCAARAAGAGGWPRPTRLCWMTSSASWTASRAAIPSCRCAGRPRACAKLAEALGGLGHRVHFTTVARLLRALSYSLQANAKTREGSAHPDRDAQFRHINDTVKAALRSEQPVISVDTEKKELVGDFENGGRGLRPKGSPVPFRVHDFRDPELGKAVPYGIYGLAGDSGRVNVGVDP